MTSTLVQKHPIKGSREFQLTDDEIHYTIESPFKKVSLSVSLDILKDKPVISSSMLSFLSKVNKEPLVELFLNKPDKETFDQFVKQLRQLIIDNDFGRLRVPEKGLVVDVERLSEAIEMVQKNIDPTEVEQFLSALKELEINHNDIKCQNNVADAFNELGFAQSLIITYAPYITYMFSGNRYLD